MAQFIYIRLLVGFVGYIQNNILKIGYIKGVETYSKNILVHQFNYRRGTIQIGTDYCKLLKSIKS